MFFYGVYLLFNEYSEKMKCFFKFFSIKTKKSDFFAYLLYEGQKTDVPPIDKKGGQVCATEKRGFCNSELP